MDTLRWRGASTLNPYFIESWVAIIIIIVRYWDIPLRLASAATYPREYVKRIHCERDLHSLLQVEYLDASIL